MSSRADNGSSVYTAKDARKVGSYEDWGKICQARARQFVRMRARRCSSIVGMEMAKGRGGTGYAHSADATAEEATSC